MPPTHQGNHPVTFVSYDDALACAEFMQGRLPTYHEWLYAAYGGTNHRFPWGDSFPADRCNVRESGVGGTTPAGLYSPHGDSPLGCTDMVGNVWEWTSTPIDEQEEMFLAMGTGWDHYSIQPEVPLDRACRHHSVGFRVVRDLKEC
ncbi:MAG: SUMF1/EgtB/PvdO family nonheme iron enzyme [Deltaproteobacteria bacterium]|nr:MAG: SUMF1/EgtB/PvdO family nonheme iron enzyme [Deltaproteobacteria bacterium]